MYVKNVVVELSKQRLDTRIFDMLGKGTPLTSYGIAKELRAQISSTNHFLSKMIENGVVVSFDRDDGKTLYALSPFLYNTEFWESTLCELSSIMDIIIKHSNKSEYEFVDTNDIDIGYLIQIIVEVLAQK